MNELQSTRRRLLLGSVAALGGMSPGLCAAAWRDQGSSGASNVEALDNDPSLPLRHAADRPYVVSSYRVVSGLAPGSYRVKAWGRSSGGQRSVFAFARVAGYSLARTSLLPSESALEVIVPGVPVGADGELAVGLHSDAGSGQWAELAGIEIEREPLPTPLLLGGDVSFLSMLERAGARYSDRHGRAGDALQILRDSGWGLVRLRLYESPGKGRGTGGYYCPEGYLDLPDVLSTARRAQALGLQVHLSLHYSDFWTNAEHQIVPARWAQQLRRLSDDGARFERLLQLVHEHTRTAVQALHDQGTPPHSVALGNEMHAGILYPWGAESATNWPRLAALLKAAADGVRQASPSARIVLHLDDGGNMDKYQYFFDNAMKHGVPFDLIGASYYPFWQKRTIETIENFCREIFARYGRQLIIMETAFNFHPTLPDGSKGQLEDNGPYPTEMSSPQGQRQFIDRLFNALKRSRCVAGVLYWDPVMIERPGVGWALSERDDQPGRNVVSNTTLFDFAGRALPVLDAYRDHAAARLLPRG